MKRKTVRSLTIVAGLTIAAFSLGAVVRLPALAGAQPEGESLEMQYANAYLQLAKAELAIFQNANSSVPGTVSADEISMRQENVQSFEQMVQNVKDGKGFDRMEVLVQMVKHDIHRAQQAIQRANMVNQQAPGTFGQDRIEKMQALEEISKLNYESGKEAMSASEADQLRWRVSLLEDEMDQLRDQVGQIGSSRR